MDTKFAVKKSSSFGYFLFFIGALISFVALGLPFLTKGSLNAAELLISLTIITLPVGLFLWIWVDTYYFIDNEILIVKSGPLKWKVPVSEITFVRLNQKTIGGIWKPTLSWDCIEVKHKKAGSVFITPDKLNDFIGHLQSLNENIEIKKR
jgi:hypothetical protein